MFDPKEFKAFADSLRKVEINKFGEEKIINNETELRIMIGRLYYSAFLHLSNKINYVKPYGEGSHEKLFKDLENLSKIQNNINLKIAAKKLKIVKELRRDADYDMVTVISAKNYELAKSEVDEIFNKNP